MLFPCVNSVFITGTDTHVGKTYVSCLLLEELRKEHQRTIGFKPVASGCMDQEIAQHLNGQPIKTQRRHADALALQQCATIQLPYKQVNPFALQPAIAPHIAAQKIQKRLDVAELCKHYQTLLAYQPDAIVVEGAGGWFTPLNEQETLADFVKQLRLPVILVVGIKLGCLNHALLTTEAILHQGLGMVGWIANTIDPHMEAFKDNVETLQKKLPVPHLMTISFNPLSP